MLLRRRGWEHVVNTKTKRSTAISVLRWTLLRHVTQSLDQINDENIKKAISAHRSMNVYMGWQ